MGKLKVLAATAIGGLAMSGSVLAATVIDQNQDNHPTVLALISSGGIAQSFQQAAGNISGAGIFLSINGLGPAAITLGLWDTPPEQGGTELARGHDATYANDHWFDVFWNPVAIAANHTYYLVITQDFITNYGIAGSTANPYSHGNAFANGYSNPANLDYAFRTYAETNFTPPAPANAPVVPEPASWGLMILGFGTAGAALRRRRIAAAHA